MRQMYCPVSVRGVVLILMLRKISMNDFTKEELTILHDMAIISIEEYDVSDEIFALKDKIQFLIEHYNDCQHLYCRKICVECGEEKHD